MGVDKWIFYYVFFSYLKTIDICVYVCGRVRACMCVYVFLNVLFVHHMHAVYQRTERGNWIPKTGVTKSCELSCGCWEVSTGPLDEQSVLLTTEKSLHSIC